MSYTRLWNLYFGIRRRCCNSNEKAFRKYGARGITCKWETFKEFYDDMWDSYNEHIQKFGEWNTTIDRIDNYGPYCKDNCRWVTHEEQQRNRLNNRLVSYQGRTQCVTAWAKEFGIKPGTLFWRFDRQWSTTKALTT